MQKTGNPTFSMVAANPEFNLGFSRRRRWLLQARTKPAAGGLPVVWTNWTLGTKVFQKQGLAQRPYLSHSLLCNTWGLTWGLFNLPRPGSPSPPGPSVL